MRIRGVYLDERFTNPYIVQLFSGSNSGKNMMLCMLHYKRLMFSMTHCMTRYADSGENSIS